MLLVIDPARPPPPLRWEGAPEAFPHVYGPLNLDAVVAALDFEPGPDGTFRLPRGVAGPG